MLIMENNEAEISVIVENPAILENPRTFGSLIYSRRY